MLPGKSRFTIAWFNPRTGRLGKTALLKSVDLRAPDKNDWLAIVRRRPSLHPCACRSGHLRLADESPDTASGA